MKKLLSVMIIALLLSFGVIPVFAAYELNTLDLNPLSKITINPQPEPPGIPLIIIR